MFCINCSANGNKIISPNIKKISPKERRKYLVQYAEKKTFNTCLKASLDINDQEQLQKCIEECQKMSTYLCDENDSY